MRPCLTRAVLCALLFGCWLPWGSRAEAALLELVTDGNGSVKLYNTGQPQLELAGIQLTSQSGWLNPSGYITIGSYGPDPTFVMLSATPLSIAEGSLSSTHRLDPERLVDFLDLGRPLAGAGDLDKNWTIDLADFSIFAASFGQPQGAGDLNRDGAVDLSDFVLLRNHFGRNFATDVEVRVAYLNPQGPMQIGAASFRGAIGTVPEPTSLQSLGVGCAALLAGYIRRRLGPTHWRRQCSRLSAEGQNWGPHEAGPR